MKKRDAELDNRILSVDLYVTIRTRYTHTPPIPIFVGQTAPLLAFDLHSRRESKVV